MADALDELYARVEVIVGTAALSQPLAEMIALYSIDTTRHIVTKTYQFYEHALSELDRLFERACVRNRTLATRLVAECKVTLEGLAIAGGVREGIIGWSNVEKLTTKWLMKTHSECPAAYAFVRRNMSIPATTDIALLYSTVREQIELFKDVSRHIRLCEHHKWSILGGVVNNSPRKVELRAILEGSAATTRIICHECE